MRSSYLWLHMENSLVVKKRDGTAFWRKDLSTLMHSLEVRGLISKIKIGHLKAWYAITEKAKKILHPEVYTKRERRNAIRRFRSISELMVYGIRSRYTEDFDRLIRSAKAIPEPYRKRQVTKFIASIMAHQRASRELDTLCMANAREFVNRLYPGHQNKEIWEKAEGKSNKIYANIMLDRAQQEQEIEMAKYGSCHFCGADITEPATVRMARQAEILFGIGTAMLCCRCFAAIDRVVGMGLRIKGITKHTQNYRVKKKYLVTSYDYESIKDGISYEDVLQQLMSENTMTREQAQNAFTIELMS